MNPIALIILLIVAGIVLLLIELFLIPGLGLTGLAAASCLIAANYFAFVHLGLVPGFITLICTLAASVGALVWFMRSKTLDKISLKQTIDSSVKDEHKTEVQVGDKGITTTRLTLIGNAQFQGRPVEVKSARGFIDENQQVQVVRIDDGMILVEQI